MSSPLSKESELMPIVSEYMKTGNVCSQYCKKLIDQIRKEFKLGKIDKYSYEYQVNLLTVIQLQVQHLETLSKQFINKKLGVIIDVKI
jgi:hypothetical protein